MMLIGRRNRAWMFVAATLLLFASGCVKQSTKDGEEVFQYETWVPASILLAGIAAVPAGVFLRQRTARLGWGLIIAGPVAAIFFAPSLFLENTRVSSSGFHIRSGIWGMTSVHDVDFAGIHQMRLTAEVSTGRRGKKSTNYYLNCDQRSGASQKVPMNNEVTQAALPSILLQAASHKIFFVDDTGGK